MRRLLVLPLVLAAAAFAAPAAHADRCVDLGGTGVCAHYGCTGDPCRIDPTTLVIYTY